MLTLPITRVGYGVSNPLATYLNSADPFVVQGSELYIKYIAGQNTTHDVFYSNPQIISEYREC